MDNKCMTEGCTKAAQYKGICKSCYSQALKLIEKGETTWDELETMGMVVLEFLKLFKQKKQIIKKTNDILPRDK